MPYDKLWRESTAASARNDVGSDDDELDGSLSDNEDDVDDKKARVVRRLVVSFD